MSKATAKRTRTYDSPRRREQARETRERIAAAARELFLENGWAATRMRDVAERAGVAEPTVYASYGSKAGLALALVDSMDMSADVHQAAAELKNAEGDASAQLAALVSFDRRLFERSGDVIGLIADARRSDPDLRAAYEEGRERGDRIRRRVFSRLAGRNASRGCRRGHGGGGLRLTLQHRDLSHPRRGARLGPPTGSSAGGRIRSSAHS